MVQASGETPRMRQIPPQPRTKAVGDNTVDQDGTIWTRSYWFQYGDQLNLNDHLDNI